MRKALAYSALGVTAWLVLGVAWTLVSMTTGLPGPARTVAASIEGTARVIDAPELPAPLDGARAMVVRQMRLGGRLVERIYRAPERIAARLLGRSGRLDRWALAHAPRVPHVPHPPAPPEAPLPPVGAGFETAVEARMEAHRERLESRIEERVERVRERVDRQAEALERRSREDGLRERSRRQRIEGLEALRFETSLDLGEIVSEALSLAAAELEGAELDVDGTRIRLVLPRIEPR